MGEENVVECFGFLRGFINNKVKDMRKGVGHGILVKELVSRGH